MVDVPLPDSEQENKSVPQDIMDRVKYILNNIFYNDIIFATLFTDRGMKLIPDYKHGTLATNCENIYWNPDYVKTFDDDQIKGFLYHEMLHCIGLTAGKTHRLESFIENGDDRYPKTKKLAPAQRSMISNWASDYEINNTVKAMGFWDDKEGKSRVPSDILYSESVKGKNLAEILNDILQQTVIPETKAETYKTINQVFTDKEERQRAKDMVESGQILMLPPKL